jgi:hypothetical protein
VRSVRRARPPIEVAAGERLLAWVPVGNSDWVGGTRDALYVPGARVPWEQVQAADWDRDEGRLVVTEVGTWGQPRPRHALTIPESATKDADRLLQLVRERVTASVLLSRHVRVSGRRGVRVVARRAPSGRSEVQWFYEYDEGIDPDDPVARAAAETALARAKDDVGLH